MRLLSILLVIIFVHSAHAQNWKTVVSGDTTYFRGGPHQSNYDMIYSYYSDILKMIFVDSYSSSGNDTTFSFYSAVRGEGTWQCLDTTAPTWLGKSVTRTIDGVEYYQNSFGDTITIRTFANIGDNWILAKDTSGRTFVGSIVGSGQSIVEGTADSFKIIDIQTYENGNPVTDPYNDKDLELSKSHGWLKTLDLYRFPNQINGWEEFGAVTDSLHITRLDNDFAHLDMHYVDLQWKYAPSNEWIHHKESGTTVWGSPYIGAHKTITHDSVISYTLLSPDSIVVSFVRKQYTVGNWQYTGGMNPHWDSASGSSISYHTDTITSGNARLIINNVQPELVYPNISSQLDSPDHPLFKSYFTDTLCGRVTLEMYLRQFVIPTYSNSCWQIGNSISGGGLYNNKTLHGFGQLLAYNISSGFALTPFTLDYYLKEYHSYLKLGSCTYGTKIDVTSLDAASVWKAANVINIYPNPAKDNVTVQSSVEDKDAVISLLDISGGTLIQKSGLERENRIATGSLAPGIYLIRVATKNGSSLSKLAIR